MSYGAPHPIIPTLQPFHAFFRAKTWDSAVQKVLNNSPAYRDELSSSMLERFQLFTTPWDKPVSDQYIIGA